MCTGRIYPGEWTAAADPDHPVYHFQISTSEDMGKLFDLEASGYFYTRLQNPTNDHVAAKIAAMEGGTAAMRPQADRQRTFLPYSTYVRVETILWHHPRSTAEPSTSLQLRLPKWGYGNLRVS